MDREHGAWQRFDASGEQAVEAAFQRGDASAQAKFSNQRLQRSVEYTYDLLAMNQVRPAFQQLR